MWKVTKRIFYSSRIFHYALTQKFKFLSIFDFDMETPFGRNFLKQQNIGQRSKKASIRCLFFFILIWPKINQLLFGLIQIQFLNVSQNPLSQFRYLANISKKILPRDD